MDAKVFSGTTKCQKDIVSENKPVLITQNCMVSMATHRAL